MTYDVKFAHGKKANVGAALAAGKINEDDFIVFSDTDDELGFVNHNGDIKRIKARTNEDYTLNGTSIGALDDGETIPAGTSIDDFIKMIITKPVHPEYIKPTIKIESSNKDKMHEVGSTVNTILTATFTKNDAGELKNISLSTGDSSNESPIVQNYEFEIKNGNNVFSATASYAEGPVKKNNLDEYDDTNSIKAGEISCNETLFVGGYKYFYGWSVNSDITTYDMDSSIGIKKNNEIVINIPVGARTFGFAYPCSIGEVSKIEYVEVNDPSMKDSFDFSTFEYILPNGSVEQYYLYSYTMAVGAAAKMTMKVTL